MKWTILTNFISGKIFSGIKLLCVIFLTIETEEIVGLSIQNSYVWIWAESRIKFCLVLVISFGWVKINFYPGNYMNYALSGVYIDIEISWEKPLYFPGWTFINLAWLFFVFKGQETESYLIYTSFLLSSTHLIDIQQNFLYHDEYITSQFMNFCFIFEIVVKDNIKMK